MLDVAAQGTRRIGTLSARGPRRPNVVRRALRRHTGPLPPVPHHDRGPHAMIVRRTAAFLSALLPFAATRAQTLIWPGEPIATVEAENLRAHVPADAAEALKGKVALADWLYDHMMRDAAFTPERRLQLLLSNWRDGHNGYSFVTPFPLVQVELAPSLPQSTIFAGGDDFRRTLIHEFAHQIANDRNGGVRGVLEGVFGRVLPNDLVSLVLFYLSTPAHQTMPRFWQEGLAIWAETTYAEPGSVWGGRGRDPLVHMVWRLDALAGGIPDASTWRITAHEWPFGSQAYVYGAAYTRFLDGYLGNRASVWRLVQEQAQQWAFLFDRGPRATTGYRHGALLQKARDELAQEQAVLLARLQQAPPTPAERLTPPEMLVGAPAWQADGALVFAARPQQGRARLHTLAADGTLAGSWTTMRALAPVRALPDRGACWHEVNWRGIGRCVVDGHTVGWRLLMPDAGPDLAGTRTLVAIQLLPAGGQALVRHHLTDGALDQAVVLPTQGTPWSPALRRGGHAGEPLCWVETDAAGSRLVLGSLSDFSHRQVLWSVRGRILHPVWSEDGRSIYCCADHTGVANAYCVGVDGASVTVAPVTHTLGGVIACVPSPDGRELALLDHDHRGPFLARIAADPSQWATTLPTIDLAWPAPGAPDTGGEDAGALRPNPIPPLPTGAADALRAVPYDGLGELRPRFWAPSTFAVPEGGYGAFGVLTDPLLTQVVQVGAGVGLNEQEPVAFASWDALGGVVQYGASLGRSERTFFDAVQVPADDGAEFDYTETVMHGAVRAGRGLFALENTWIGHVSFGIEDHDEDDGAARRYGGFDGIAGKRPFRDTEHYAELTFGYDDSIVFPTGYAPEDGLTVLATYRHGGLGGDLERNVAFGHAGYVWSVLPEAGHQLVTRAQLGWSDGDDVLQGNFSVGGGLGRGLPRGYQDGAVGTGRYLLGGSVAYRFPVWRPFVASSTTPFRGRQVVLELFGDAANVGDDGIGEDRGGAWFASVGGEVYANAEFWDAMLSPGLGVAFQLDGEKDVKAYLTVGFGF
jgi:hypothetical protein